VFSFHVEFSGAPSRSVPVVAGSGALGRLVGEVAAAFPGHLLVVVSDDRVFPLHGRGVLEGLRRQGLRAEALTFPAGEASKTRETKSALEDGLGRLDADRDTVLVAVGGGVTGDLAGFVAATWHRGVPVVQAPTSLLAMADAALGGKTAVNTPSGKNQVGAFHQPWALYADLDTLATLPERELRAGLAEVVKAACLADAETVARLEADAGALGRRESGALERAVRLGLEVKSRVVSADEREAGIRAALNFGHTVAHALEAASGFRIPHGEAVAMGLVAEARLAAARFGFPDADVERLRDLLSALGLPVGIPAGVDIRAALAAARKDKKNRRGVLRVCVPPRLGDMPSPDRLLREVSEEDLLAALRPAV
jgi:3-dehydroquinate synthase